MAAIANGMRAEKEQTVTLLQSSAVSETMEEYHSNLENLKRSEIWRIKSLEPFRNWIGKTWLPLDKVCLK